MAKRYAASTEVSSERSRGEIERTLMRYGATAFAYAWEGATAVIAFRLRNRNYRFRLPLPDRRSDEIRLTPSRRWLRDDRAQEEAWEQACRQRWRALALVIKAKLEAVESGITTIEEEFLSQTVLPDGRTLGEWVPPQIQSAYEQGRMPALLPWTKTGEG